MLGAEQARIAIERAKPVFIAAGTDVSIREALPPGAQEYLERFRIHSLLSVPMRARDRVIGLATLFRDTTAAPFSAEDRSFAEELLARVSLSVVNADLYAGARRAVQLREDFMAIASHELKTPLTPLRMQLQLLSHLLGRGDIQMAGPLERKLRDVVLDSDQQVARLTRLVEDILDSTRLSTGRLTLRFEDVELNHLVEQVIARVRADQPFARSPIEFSAGEPVHGSWDRLRVEQVVMNLLTNALKFGEDKPIRISCERVDGRARLTVADRGIGVAAVDHSRIFERLERAVPVSRYGGLGMGLFIARQIAEGHGGSLSIQSEIGQGAAFKLELPLRRLPEAGLIK